MERLYVGSEALRTIDRPESSQAETVSVEALHPVFTEERFSTGVQLDRGNPLTTVLEDMVNQRPDKLLPWSKFMETSLFHDKWGYYTSKVSIGADENIYDFWTSPEKSSAFGVTIERLFFKVWEAMDEPDEFEIVEMGAGNGSLAKSLLDWAKKDNPAFYDKIHYTIVEQSLLLIENQKEKLKEFGQDKVTCKEGSADSLEELGITNITGVFISNELPDTFPIERVTRLNGEIVQKYVTIENGEWVEVWGKPSLEVSEYINEYNYVIEEGVEEPINLKAVIWQRNVDRALKEGAIVTIDYGRGGQVGIENEVVIRSFGKIDGKQIDEEDMFAPYKELGKFDITADVDFGVLETIAMNDGLKRAFSGLQQTFLENNGFDEEIDKLEALSYKTGALEDAENCYDALEILHEEGYTDFHVSIMISKGVDKHLI